MFNVLAFLGNMFMIHTTYNLKPYLPSQLNLRTRISTRLLLNQLSTTGEGVADN